MKKIGGRKRTDIIEGVLRENERKSKRRDIRMGNEKEEIY